MGVHLKLVLCTLAQFGGPILTIHRTVFEMWLGLRECCELMLIVDTTTHVNSPI